MLFFENFSTTLVLKNFLLHDSSKNIFFLKVFEKKNYVLYILFKIFYKLFYKKINFFFEIFIFFCKKLNFRASITFYFFDFVASYPFCAFFLKKCCCFLYFLRFFSLIKAQKVYIITKSVTNLKSEEDLKMNMKKCVFYGSYMHFLRFFLNHQSCCILYFFIFNIFFNIKVVVSYTFLFLIYL
jgi:hypothetical protein